MRKRRRDDTKKQNKKEEFYKLKTNKKAFSNDFVTLQNGKGKLQKLNRLYLGKILLGAVIAQWIRLCLPTCGLGFKSQTRHLRLFHSQILNYICHCIDK